ncbi:hypothetical protein K502DRAFT_353882, partial [Neoconidiobolus thromboides FSU 785]
EVEEEEEESSEKKESKKDRSKKKKEKKESKNKKDKEHEDKDKGKDKKEKKDEEEDEDDEIYAMTIDKCFHRLDFNPTPFTKPFNTNADLYQTSPDKPDAGKCSGIIKSKYSLPGLRVEGTGGENKDFGDENNNR